MKKLSVYLEYCYGIKKLEHNFDFTQSKTYSIYAANGSMKTSFAKTFSDLSKGLESKDEMFPGRATVRRISDENNMEIKTTSVFVIEPNNDRYSSDKTSTLLVNKILKEQYDDIWLDIKNLEAELIKELKKPSGMRKEKEISDEVSKTIMSTEGKFLDAIQRVEKEVTDGKDPVFNEADYKILFNDKVINFLEDKEVQSDLNEYIGRYNELVEQSKYFRKGIFNHTNASTIAKTLVSNGFFNASHTISLSDETNATKNEITSEKDLENVIEQEMHEILNDEKLLTAFQNIDKKLGNQELKAFREYLADHREYVPELSNVNYFKNRIWVDYFKTCLTTFKKLIATYTNAKDQLKKIQEQANKERTKWTEVVDLFNSRFNVPFILSVENQSDVILEEDLPSLKFEFADEKDRRIVEPAALIKVLSSGERKALYILNILFEIEARKDQNIETLIIVDDIADSFDYKNKYAIIEYLKDNTERDNFYQIILTHNFDFFRTVESRFKIYKYCLMVEKKIEGIDLIPAEYIKDPFAHFIENTDDDAKFLALIPFFRNIVEYLKGEGDSDFELLTSTLHRKSDTDTISKSNINDIITRVFDKKLSINEPDKVVADLYLEVADKCLSECESLKLENKIVLSVAIRLKAESFMIKNINDDMFINSIEKSQTAVLASRYMADNPSKIDEINVLKKVNLITPQNIHINSFMYEPILDMSDIELRNLYEKVSSLV